VRAPASEVALVELRAEKLVHAWGLESAAVMEFATDVA